MKATGGIGIINHLEVGTRRKFLQIQVSPGQAKRYSHGDRLPERGRRQP